MNNTSNNSNNRFLSLLKDSQSRSINGETPEQVYSRYFDKQSKSEDSLAFPIDKFAEEFGLKVDREALINESGIIKKKQIMISLFESTLRQNFSVAHEMGHHFLHPCEEGKNRTSEDIYTTEQKKEEEEANFIAGNLLMPEVLLKKQYDMQKEQNVVIEDIVRILSKKFQVSGLAIIFRLKELGIIDRWIWIDVI
jgi:Zn-dependent peptidase ImmA (M78 family)